MATQIFFSFTPTWGRFPFWLTFFRWVETTNYRREHTKKRVYFKVVLEIIRYCVWITQSTCIVSTWNPKQPFINHCFNWMIANIYIGNEWLFNQTSISKLVVWGSRYISILCLHVAVEFHERILNNTSVAGSVFLCVLFDPLLAWEFANNLISWKICFGCFSTTVDGSNAPPLFDFDSHEHVSIVVNLINPLQVGWQSCK